METSQRAECEKLEDSEDNSTPEPKESGEEGCHQNGLALPVEEDGRASRTLWKRSTGY